MNSGCAVVSNRAIGAAPFLIRQNENGLMYETVDDLYEKVKYLLDHTEHRRQMGRAAYETVTKEWCAEVAAERFLYLADAIMEGRPYTDLYPDGIMSMAE